MDFSGHLRLRASRRPDGRTFVSEQSFSAPFHIGKGYWDGEVLEVQVVNPTAGVLAGDRMDLQVAVDPGAALCVTTPAATRAFMMRPEGSAVCRQELSVKKGGWLEYSPEPLFPHKQSEFRQETALSVERGGSLFYLDSLAPGRVALGESWSWRSLTISLCLKLGDEIVLKEQLDASGAELAGQAEASGMKEAWFTTTVLVAERLPKTREWLGALDALHGNGLWFGATCFHPGCWLLRLIAPSSQISRDALLKIREGVASALPLLRVSFRKL